MLYRAPVFEFLQCGDGHAFFAIRFVEREGEVDAIHDGILCPTTTAHLLHNIDTETLPVGIFPDFSAVEGRVCELLKQVPFVSVQIDAIQAGGLCVRRRLTCIFNDFV
ncbi:hypothetical protein SDC9_189019 [bioreactor metagenome]|uniref:Uncharacterized protein n=1 Tax=bioreactor metagenome TaxID=1076179 RepID=A0A645I1U3_9ZZZZ